MTPEETAVLSALRKTWQRSVAEDAPRFIASLKSLGYVIVKARPLDATGVEIGPQPLRGKATT
jgi:hypothetical protein